MIGLSLTMFLLLGVQDRRMKQQREVVRKEKETAEKIAARAFAQSYLADLVPSVFGTLSDNGYFFDPVERGGFFFFSVSSSSVHTCLICFECLLV